MRNVSTDHGARTAILDATLALLRERPGHAPSLTDIAARAQFSRQAIYRHFGSRAGLLTAALEEIDTKLGAAAAVAEIRAATTPAAELEALATWWSAHVEDFIDLARHVHAERLRDADLAAAWAGRTDALRQACALVVKDCEAAGALHPALTRREATDLLAGLLSIPLWDQLRTERGWRRRQYAERITHVIRSALLSPPRQS